MQPQFFHIPSPFPLELGGELPHPTLAFHTYGNPSNPVVWVCHPFTASANVFDWWPDLFGAKEFFNPDQYFIVCANVLGSGFGSTGPLSENLQQGGTAYFHDFPQLTIRDMANAHESLRKHLKIKKIHLLIGAGMGGQQALEWSIQEPDIAENLVLIATNARQSAWAIALNESQRMAIEADITWLKHHPQAGESGLRAAQSLALLSYKNYQAYDQFLSDLEPTTEPFKSAVFQQQESIKGSNQLNAFSFYRLTQAMDTHHIGRNRGSISAALLEIRARTLVIGISSDMLYPCAEQRFLADKIPGATYREMHTDYGHGGFLTEISRLKHLLQIFLHS